MWCDVSVRVRCGGVAYEGGAIGLSCCDKGEAAKERDLWVIFQATALIASDDLQAGLLRVRTGTTFRNMSSETWPGRWIAHTKVDSASSQFIDRRLQKPGFFFCSGPLLWRYHLSLLPSSRPAALLDPSCRTNSGSTTKPTGNQYMELEGQSSSSSSFNTPPSTHQPIKAITLPDSTIPRTDSNFLTLIPILEIARIDRRPYLLSPDLIRSKHP